MATDLIELRDSFVVETGGLVTDEDQIVDYLIAGLTLYNGTANQAFTATGTLLDRDATGKERYALLVCAKLAYLNGRIIYMAEQAIVASNAAGRTDLREIVKQLAKRRDELLEDLKDTLASIVGNEAYSEISAEELGETLNITGRGSVTSAMLESWE